MKYGFLAAIVLILGNFGISGCTPEAVSSSNNGKSLSEPVVIDESNAGKVVIAHAGQIVEIRLKGNATTGYEWVETSMDTFSESPRVLERVASTYQPDKAGKNVVGSGGTSIKQFKAVGKGRARVTMQYLRTWEGQASAAKTLSFDITVE